MRLRLIECCLCHGVYSNGSQPIDDESVISIEERAYQKESETEVHEKN